MGVRWDFPRSRKNEIFSYRSLPKKVPYVSYYKAIAMEICENSLLARYDEKHPVKVEFTSFKMNPKDIPGYNVYRTVVELCMEFCDEDFDIDGREHYRRILGLLEGSYIDVMRISNFNTISMINDKNNIAISWREFLIRNGIKYKKASSLNVDSSLLEVSDMNTIFISTRNKYGYEYSQGIASFTSYKIGDCITKGIGYYGNEDMPKLTATNLDETLSRKDLGTDYYILSYDRSHDYRRDIINIIIEEFEENIKDNSLCVNIDDVYITSSNLEEIKYTSVFLDNKLEIVTDIDKDIISKINIINKKRNTEIKQGIVEREITLLEYFKYKMGDGFKHLNEDHQKVYQMIIDNIEEVHKYRTSDGFSHVIGVSATTIDLILLKVGIGSYNRFYNYIKQIFIIDLNQSVNKM